MATLENCIGYGLHSDRPAAGAPGAQYFESDTKNGYRDNGVTWDLISNATPPAAAFTVHFITTDYTIPGPGYLVVVQADGCTVTLPDAASNAGLSVEIFVGAHNTTLAGAGSDMLNSDTTSTSTYLLAVGGITARSDGTNWCFVGGW